MHEVDSKRLAVSMGELQRAHLQQNRVVRELEDAVARLPVLKKTVRNQQQVIVSLEGVLRRTVAQVKELKAANTVAEEAARAAAAARDTAMTARSRAEQSAAQAHVKAEGALALAARAEKSRMKAAERGQSQQLVAPATVQSLPVPMPPGAAAAEASGVPAASQSLPARRPSQLEAERATVRPRAPQRAPQEVAALKRELVRSQDQIRQLQQAGEEAKRNAAEASDAAAAAEAESQSALERARQAEEAAQAADNDLLEVGRRVTCPETEVMMPVPCAC